jgi:hypothetical protein
VIAANILLSIYPDYYIYPTCVLTKFAMPRKTLVVRLELASLLYRPWACAVIRNLHYAMDRPCGWKLELGTYASLIDRHEI